LSDCGAERETEPDAFLEKKNRARSSSCRRNPSDRATARRDSAREERRCRANNRRAATKAGYRHARNRHPIKTATRRGRNAAMEVRSLRQGAEVETVFGRQGRRPRRHREPGEVRLNVREMLADFEFNRRNRRKIDAVHVEKHEPRSSPRARPALIGDVV